MRFTIPSLLGLAMAGFVAAQPSTPELSPNQPSAFSHPRTNAKRFAAGLPPLPPKHRHRSRTPNGGELLVSPTSGSKVDTARRSVASPSLPALTRCNLLVKRASDGFSFGYITGKPRADSYNQLQSSQLGALEVTFSYTPDDPSSLEYIDLLATDATAINKNYPYFGAISGDTTNSAEISPTSPGTLYLGGTSQTTKGSSPVQGTSTLNAMVERPSRAESAIWTFDPITRQLSAQWVNTGRTLPATYLAAWGSGALRLTGSVRILAERSGQGYVEATLTCVSPLDSSASK